MKQALLVGINRYGETSGLMPLQCAETDAQTLAGVLAGDRYGFKTTVLLGREATQDRVLDALEQADSGEVFLFFFAGHGSLSKGHYRLHAADDTIAGRRSIRFDDLAATFRHDLRFPNVLTILDACRNEMSAVRGSRGFDAVSARDLQCAVAAEEKRIDIFYGCSEGEFSYEDVKLGHGLLTYSLIEALESADVELTSDLLADLAAGRLRRLSADRGWRQTLNRYYLPGPEKIVLATSGARKLPKTKSASESFVPPPPPPPPEPQWHVSVDGRPSAGMSLAVLKREIRAGRVDHGMLVWSLEIGNWAPAGRVSALADAFPVVEVLPLPPPPPPPSSGRPRVSAAAEAAEAARLKQEKEELRRSVLTIIVHLAARRKQEEEERRRKENPEELDLDCGKGVKDAQHSPQPAYSETPVPGADDRALTENEKTDLIVAQIAKYSINSPRVQKLLEVLPETEIAKKPDQLLRILNALGEPAVTVSQAGCRAMVFFYRVALHNHAFVSRLEVRGLEIIWSRYIQAFCLHKPGSRATDAITEAIKEAPDILYECSADDRVASFLAKQIAGDFASAGSMGMKAKISDLQALWRPRFWPPLGVHLKQVLPTPVSTPESKPVQR